MEYMPLVFSAKTQMGFHAPGYSGILLGDIRTAGAVRYAYLLVVSAMTSPEPVLIVSAEFLAGGPRTVPGVFDENGHQTLYGEAGDWTEERKFAAKAVAIANERLRIDLKAAQRRKPWWKFW